jgi:hypothetical protein
MRRRRLSFYQAFTLLWEIKCSELESEAVQKVFRTLKHTGRLELEGDDLRNQKTLFPLE